ncbi:MAG: exodeoxyribonuclease VII small subunit [Luteolibacter sp.]
MPARKKNPDEEPPATFEDALGSLEEIVEAMEHEQLPLEELVAYYEKGSSLLNRCEAILQAARGRIELITLRNQGEIALESSPATPQDPLSTRSDEPDSSDADDDIRLF